MVEELKYKRARMGDDDPLCSTRWKIFPAAFFKGSTLKHREMVRQSRMRYDVPVVTTLGTRYFFFGACDGVRCRV